MRRNCGSPSPGSTATSASRPGPMAPTTASSTVTLAVVTRWMRASIAQAYATSGIPAKAGIHADGG